MRTSDELPGKNQAIQNEPSDVIVNCSLIGSHSEDAGVKTVISNVMDQNLIFQVMFKGLYELGLLKPALRSALGMNNIQHILSELYHEMDPATLVWGRTTYVGDVMFMVKCSCEYELYREYGDGFKPDERISRLMKFHRNLGHIVEIKRLMFNGSGWDDQDM